MRMGGWSSFGEPPDIPKAVYIAAPHTSNWDGFWALVYKVSVGLDIRFFGKEALFWFPLGTLLRALGGIPLDRSKAGSAVDQAVHLFNTNEHFNFGLAPEGTRSLTEGWKSGFYRIAVQAGVPVVPGMLDFGTKRIGIGEPIKLSGDMDADMEKIRKVYEGIVGRRPENASPIRMR